MLPRSNIALVVPAYNEGEKIAEILTELTTSGYTIIVVDDGSKDDTAEVIARYPVHLIRHPFNMGQGAAIQTGLAYALGIGAEIMITFDADGQHCLEDIDTLIAPIINDGKDVVFGSRFLGRAENMSWLRGWFIRGMSWLSRNMSQVVLTDANCGIRAFNRKAARVIRITQNRMAHTLDIIEEVGAHKLAYAEAPVTIKYTDYSLRKGQKMGGAFAIFFDWMFRI